MSTEHEVGGGLRADPDVRLACAVPGVRDGLVPEGEARLHRGTVLVIDSVIGAQFDFPDHVMLRDQAEPGTTFLLRERHSLAVPAMESAAQEEGER